MHAHTTAGAGLPWAGMPNVKCSLQEEGGVITGKCVISRPGGQQPIVLTARVPEGPVEKELLQRYAKDLAVAKTGGTVGLFGFLKKIKKMAKSVVRGKVLATLAKGFKSVMKIPVLGPALGVAVPALGATYMAMKGAEALGISPWQAARMRREKNPRKRAAFARKIRARSRLISRSRWMAARRRAQGGRHRGRGWGRGWGQRPRRSWRSYRGRGGRASGHEADTTSAEAGFRMFYAARGGSRKARLAIQCIERNARRGNKKAILARKVLGACARHMLARAKTAKTRSSGEHTDDYEATLANSSGCPEDDLENLITASGGHVEDVMLAAGVNDGEQLMAIAGVDLEMERGPEDDAAAAGAQPAMDLGAYYNILPGQSAAYQTVAGYDNGYGNAGPVLSIGHEKGSGYGNAGPVLSIGHEDGGGYGNAGPVLSIAGAPTHTHQVPMPDYHCTPAVASVQTSAAGMHLPLIVIGADGVQRVKSWNGLRWVWSELRPHLGIKSETQGFGLRDAMLLGMRQIQQRELAS